MPTIQNTARLEAISTGSRLCRIKIQIPSRAVVQNFESIQEEQNELSKSIQNLEIEINRLLIK